MNLYLISQDKNNGYDTYDSAVVIAENEDKARLIHPNDRKWNGKEQPYDSWVDSELVIVELIGKSTYETSGVVCASFNAGQQGI